MDNHNILYYFSFTAEQLEFLRSKKYKIDRMECFMSLVPLVAVEPKLEQVSRTKQVEILSGQVMIEYTHLAKLWNKDRKTIPKILKALEDVKIISSQKVGEYHIYTLHTLHAWKIDGSYHANEWATKQTDYGRTYHKEVPPANVFDIVDKESNINRKDGYGFNVDNSNITTEVKSSATGLNTSPLSSQYKDSGNVSKLDVDGKTSTPSGNGISSLSESGPNHNDNLFFPTRKRWQTD